MTLLTFIQSLFRPNIRILICADDKTVMPGTTAIEDAYYSPGPHYDFGTWVYWDRQWIHTCLDGRLLPKGTFKDHPDYFALVNGERNENQPCFGSPGLLQLVLNQVGQIKTDKIISVSMGDTFMWCECEKCKGRKPSETLITFINTIARTYPDKKFSTLVYYQAQVPTIKPLPNVQIMLTTISVTKDEPIETGTRGEAIEFRRDLKAWRKLTSNIIIWDYTSNFRHLLMPYPVVNHIGKNIQYYAQLGVRDLIVQNNSGLGHEFTELKSHLIASMMNNPYQCPDRVINDFGSEYYGKAWRFIKEYIDLTHAEMEKARKAKTPVHWFINWADPKCYRDSYLSDENIAKYCRILSQALSVDLTDKQILNVWTVWLQIYYVMIELGIADETHIKQFRWICEQLGKVTVNENHLSWEDYLNGKV